MRAEVGRPDTCGRTGRPAEGFTGLLLTILAASFPTPVPDQPALPHQRPLPRQRRLERRRGPFFTEAFRGHFLPPSVRFRSLFLPVTLAHVRAFRSVRFFGGAGSR